MNLREWINDWRWAINAKRARAWRRDITYGQRRLFDEALRPPSKRDGPRVCTFITYPDAIYHITVDDLTRAMIISTTGRRAAS